MDVPTGNRATPSSSRDASLSMVRLVRYIQMYIRQYSSNQFDELLNVSRDMSVAAKPLHKSDKTITLESICRTNNHKNPKGMQTERKYQKYQSNWNVQKCCNLKRLLNILTISEAVVAIIFDFLFGNISNNCSTKMNPPTHQVEACRACFCLQTSKRFHVPFFFPSDALWGRITSPLTLPRTHTP